MKTKFSIIAAGLLLARLAVAQTTLTQNYTPGLLIPVGNPVGLTDQEAFTSGLGDTISNVTVNLNFSGGYNGDLYVSIHASNGTSVVLLNDPGAGVNGFGAGGAGMNILLTDASVNLIQDETNNTVLSGDYHPATSLASFAGGAVAGDWTLFVADLGIGTGSPTLVSWSLNIDPVPEPSTFLLGGLAATGLLAGRSWKNRKI